MNGDSRHLKLARQGALVERFDVLQLMHKLDFTGVDFSGGEGVKHESVVGIRRMRDANCSAH
jgi:hypothetical protein